ncbi:MAG TPA: restriction endonuclease [Clostridia bacterium]|nr:restriction endonuclease [Clostridia bacterium]
MPIPTYEEIMLPILGLLSDGNERDLKYCEEKLAEMFKLSKDELNLRLQSGQRIFYSRVGWAKTYLKEAGLIESPKRGVFRITERGQEVLKENPKKLDSKYLMKYEEFRDFKGRKGGTPPIPPNNGGPGEETPIERIDEAFKEIRASLAKELLQKLKEIDFYKFEEIVLDLLVKMGYGGSREEAKKATRRTNDEGIDGIINEDRLGLDRIYIQAKRWQNTVVGRPEIQKFSGALDTPGANKGIFITTSTFSNDAVEYANRLTNKKIILIDGYQLAEYMIDFNVGVSVQEVYEIKRIDNDYFEE